MTFQTRPSVEGPTGIIMGWPVSRTLRPRVRPSVEDMATVRTMPPGSCDSTSSTVPTWPTGVSPSTTSAV